MGVIDDKLLLAALAGSLVAFLLQLTFLAIVKIRKNQAMNGDTDAATKLILPCYKPLYRGLCSLFLILLGVQAIIIGLYPALSVVYELYVVQYHALVLLTAYLISPVLLVQDSISTKSFKITGLILIPYWLLASLFFFLQMWKYPNFDVGSPTYNRQLGFKILFLLWTFIPPFVLYFMIILKQIKSRVHLNSASNRSSLDFLLVFTIIYAIANSYHIFIDSIATDDNIDSSNKYDIAGFIITIALIVSNSVFPFLLHRALLADTKFWRGLGRHNQNGILASSPSSTSPGEGAEATSGPSAAPKPEINIKMASKGLQNMMSQVGNIVIDFAFLQVASKIGEGATAVVYEGLFKDRRVAVKLYTPAEITEEVLDEYVKESALSRSLHHTNVVEFIGLCVRPPQIAMVVELCLKGNLKSHMLKHPSAWTAERRLGACLDAARALEYMHQHGVIHRDIKTENFFVGDDFAVKLGDFGECCHERSRDSLGEDERMDILGTVAYMAPELINPKPFKYYYTTAVDVYALGVTMWEIWAGKDCYEGKSTFDIYRMVEAGERLSFEGLGLPPVVVKAIELSWQQNPEERGTAADVLALLEPIMDNSFGLDAASESKSSSSLTDASSISFATLSGHGSATFSMFERKVFEMVDVTNPLTNDGKGDQFTVVDHNDAFSFSQTPPRARVFV